MRGNRSWQAATTATGGGATWADFPAASFAHVRHVPRPRCGDPAYHRASEFVQGDLGGKVLRYGVLPPASVDFSPYWWPAPFAPTIPVADALAWERAGLSISSAVCPVTDRFGHMAVASWCRVNRHAAVSIWLVQALIGSRLPAGGPVYPRGTLRGTGSMPPTRRGHMDGQP